MGGLNNDVIKKEHGIIFLFWTLSIRLSVCLPISPSLNIQETFDQFL